MKNNFNALRMTFAVAVVFCHSFALVGLTEPTLFGHSVGNIAVMCFFSVSGYLITESYNRNQNLFGFIWNRFLRIVPAFVVVMFVSGKVAALCGYYRKNPVPYIIDGPIWTLPWEGVCYAAVAALGLAGVLSRSSFTAFFAVAWLLYLLNYTQTADVYIVIIPMLIVFMMGAFLSVIKDHLNFKRCALAAGCGLAIIISPTFFHWIMSEIRSHIVFLWTPQISDGYIRTTIMLVCLPTVLLFIGLQSWPALSRKTDVSYGTYIYAWPVMQTIISFFINRHLHLNAYAIFTLTLLFTIPLAWLSWIAVEKPCLRIRHRRSGNLPIFKGVFK